MHSNTLLLLKRAQVDNSQIHSLLKLNITWQRKVGVCAVFLVGFLVTIIAVVRLQYLIR